ncbi:MAG: hypothetical protein K2Y32_24160 [Candidatus Obscuribacterales bacterium]|jgi:hypothetical protein|uniref:Uncharacterized protein n=1 Tax=Candidatus Obscuribacter phosphatis TaxID=1906157 RepID=A0A8J7TMP2_9BACT|nr:hypothetical protein [Candidatus Obscuribacter phosphatis]MBX9942378.1 hypothetical protein [Candidatus Obscuribacterales bacterium]
MTNYHHSNLQPEAILAARQANHQSSVQAVLGDWAARLTKGTPLSVPQPGESVSLGSFTVRNWCAHHEEALKQLRAMGWTIKKEQAKRSGSPILNARKLTFSYKKPKPAPFVAAWPYPTR